MATLELAGKLAILEGALKRLEAELERDENWRALHRHAIAGDESDEGRAQRDARDTRLVMALEGNSIYRAWKDMHEAAEVLRAMQAQHQPGEAVNAPDAGTPETETPQAAAPIEPTPSRTTLAEALQQARDARVPSAEASKPVEPVHHYDLPQEIADLIAAEIQGQGPASESEQDLGDVGQRATEAVDRILSIPTVDPVDPARIEEARRQGWTGMERSLQERVERLASAPRLPQIEDDIGHSVPLEAEDLAFLLSPASPRPKRKAETTPAPEPPPAAAEGASKPFLDRLLAEAQTAPARASILAPRTDPLPPPAPEAAPPADPAEAAKPPRLSRLLKAWSKH